MANPKPFQTLGNVTPNTLAKAQQVMDYLDSVLGRSCGVLWGMGSSSEHATGRAVDFMVTQHGMGRDAQMGAFILRYLLDNANSMGLKWAIWEQRLYYPDGSNYLMEDRGNSTENHYDHVHAFFDDIYLGDEMPLSDADIERIASAVWTHQVKRSDGHFAAAWAHLGDIANRIVMMFDGRTTFQRTELPALVWKHDIKRADGHVATAEAQLGDMSNRIVQMYDKRTPGDQS